MMIDPAAYGIYKHHKIAKCMYAIDQLFNFGLLAIVVFVFLRGLGIVK